MKIVGQKKKKREKIVGQNWATLIWGRGLSVVNT